MKQRIRLSTPELYELRSILRRAADRAERNKRIEDAARMAEAIIDIDIEIEKAP